MGGVEVNCFIPGPLFSLLGGPFSFLFFLVCQWLQLTADNGPSMPYVAYVELDVSVFGTAQIQKREILVVMDPPEPSPETGTPGVLGMNVIHECCAELNMLHPFDVLLVQEAPEPWKKALEKCHEAQTRMSICTSGVTRVTGKHAVYIPGGTVKLAVTCSQKCFPSSHALFEPFFNHEALPAGLLVISCYGYSASWYCFHLSREGEREN